MVGINEYLAVFPWTKARENIFETELNENLLNIIPNGWSKQAYVQGFDCE